MSFPAGFIDKYSDVTNSKFLMGYIKFFLSHDNTDWLYKMVRP